MTDPHQHFYKTIVDRLATAAFVVDRAGTVLFANPAARVLFDLPDIGVRFAWLFFDADRCEAFVRSIADSPSASMSASFEGDAMGSAGTPVRLEVQAVGGPRDADFDGIVLAVLDVTARHRREQQMVASFMTDGLTGLANRTAFMKRAAELRHNGATGSVAEVDLDGFKQINDRHGHAVGDEVLNVVAARLVQSMPASATVARWGGDEFVVLLPDTDLAAAEGLLTATLDAIRQPMIVGSQSICVSLSVGIAKFAGQPIDRALSDCDIALYAAKSRGRDQVVVFGHDVRKIVDGRRDLADTVLRLSSKISLLETQNRTDALTGLLNRRALDEYDGQVLAHGDCAWTQAAILFIDIDHFSAYNHHYQDRGGDLALREVAMSLAKEARTSDLVFRKGGEEFVLLLPDSDLAFAQAAGERMRAAVAALGIPHIGSETCALLSITIGVAWGGPGQSISQLIARAGDQAMAAKRGGFRNRVHSDLVD